MKYRSLKIKIISPQDSVNVQDFLFSKGCFWTEFGDIDKHARKTEAYYLFVDSEGRITWSNSKEAFDVSSYDEIDLVPTFRAVKVKVPLINIDGRKYKKSDVLKAISGVQVVK